MASKGFSELVGGQQIVGLARWFDGHGVIIATATDLFELNPNTNKVTKLTFKALTEKSEE